MKLCGAQNLVRPPCLTGLGAGSKRLLIGFASTRRASFAVGVRSASSLQPSRRLSSRRIVPRRRPKNEIVSPAIFEFETRRGAYESVGGKSRFGRGAKQGFRSDLVGINRSGGLRRRSAPWPATRRHRPALPLGSIRRSAPCLVVRVGLSSARRVGAIASLDQVAAAAAAMSASTASAAEPVAWPFSKKTPIRRNLS